MIKGKLIFALSLCLLTGCQQTAKPLEPLTQQSDTIKLPEVFREKELPPCRMLVTAETGEQLDCDLDYLLSLHVMANKTPWTLRKSMVQSSLSDVDTTLVNIILAQPADTPYQSRLRAQQWVSAIQNKLSEKTREWLIHMVSVPSQRLLQLESEGVIQRREWRVTEDALRQAERKVEEQAKQIRALLQIEASLLNKDGQ